MPLIRCSECSREISDRAERCPHCGIARSTVAAGSLRKLALVLAVLLWLVVGLTVLFSTSSTRDVGSVDAPGPDASSAQPAQGKPGPR